MKTEGSAQQEMLDPGIKYDPWKFTCELGKGSFGTVYKIEREDFGVKVDAALKIIPIPQSRSEVTSIRSQGLTDQEVTEYFYGVAEEVVKEFQLMFQLKGHSNIVSYEDHEIREHDDGVGYDIIIRMELLRPLDEFSTDHFITQKEVAELGMDICRALERCHSLGIVHRDIKPSNIFVSKQGDFKLGDFGIARKMENQTAELSRKGTFGFMAPEVAAAKRYDFTVDLYSLGLVMYKLLNGHRLPFMPPAGQKIMPSDQSNATVKRLSGEPLPAPTQACDALAAVILKASAFNPEDRYQNATEFRNAIKDAMPAILAADEANKPSWEQNRTTILTEENSYSSGSGNSYPSGGNYYSSGSGSSQFGSQDGPYPTTLIADNNAFASGGSDAEDHPTTIFSENDAFASAAGEDPSEDATTVLSENAVYASGGSNGFNSADLDKLIEASGDPELTMVIAENFVGADISQTTVLDESEDATTVLNETEDATTVLGENAAGTTVLGEGPKGTTVLDVASASAPSMGAKPEPESATSKKPSAAAKKQGLDRKSKPSSSNAASKPKIAKPTQDSNSQQNKKPIVIIIAIVAAIVIAIAAILGMQGGSESEESSSPQTTSQQSSSQESSSQESASEENATKQVDVPTVKGMTQQEAEEAIKAAGLTPEAEHSSDPDVEKGIVISQQTTGKADEGAKVAFVVSDGVEQVEVPYVKGMTKDEAAKALEAVGLVADFNDGKYSSDVAEGKILRQMIKSGSMVKKGTKVRLTPSLGKEPQSQTTSNSTSNNHSNNYSKPKPKPNKADISANKIKIG